MAMLPSYFNRFNNSFIYASEDYGKYIVTDQYAVSRHNSGFCQFEYCKYYDLLLGGGESILEKLVHFTFNYISVNCFYAVYKYLIHNGMSSWHPY